MATFFLPNWLRSWLRPPRILVSAATRPEVRDRRREPAARSGNDGEFAGPDGGDGESPGDDGTETGALARRRAAANRPRAGAAIAARRYGAGRRFGEEPGRAGCGASDAGEQPAGRPQ